MLGALGGVSLVAMILSVRAGKRYPVVIWGVTVALMAISEFGVLP